MFLDRQVHRSISLGMGFYIGPVVWVYADT